LFHNTEISFTSCVRDYFVGLHKTPLLTCESFPLVGCLDGDKLVKCAVIRFILNSCLKSLGKIMWLHYRNQYDVCLMLCTSRRNTKNVLLSTSLSYSEQNK